MAGVSNNVINILSFHQGGMMSVGGDIPSMALSVTQAWPCEYRRKNKGRKKKKKETRKKKHQG